MSNINQWLSGLGLEKYGPVFVEAEIEFSDLASLSEDDLKELGLPLGPRRRVAEAIRQLQGGASPAARITPPAEMVATKSETGAPATASPSDAERRHLTVMFIDLVGSTEMAGRIDAEDMRNVITSYQNTVAGVVSRYEGFVAKFMGDGVLCYFGWPRANEDDAERAVRAGLSIIDAVKKTKAPEGTPLATRIGIATGVVIVGDLIGAGATQEAAVVGETPNLAARLQGIAKPNQLVLPGETRRLLGGAFELQSLGAQDLKGIGAAVEAFVVVGEASQESRFSARQTGTLTPIVGREREIELMLERWAMARAHKGQMVIVSGEAGIGKSRIIRAVIDAVAQDEHTRMTYQCSPYHTDSAFYPVTQQMAFAAGFAPSDSAETRLDKLEALLGKDVATLKLIAPLMGLDGAGRFGALDLSPAQQRAQTMQALARLLVRQAAQRPVLLVYEDLHWIDPTSLELLETLLDAIAEQPIMILATARPTFEYGFGGHPIVTRFALNRLGKDQIGAIVAKLTGGRALPDEIMAIITQRTDGVPLFVEELTKTILESGAMKEDGERFVLNGPLSTIAIPATLHDSLMARLDRLQPIKEVAQIAACIGREFSHRLLAQIARLSEPELATALNGLIDAELIYRRGLPPEATYLFKHALVRDAAHESLLRSSRRQVHARIVNALESGPGVRDSAETVLLGQHSEAAELKEKAIDYWQRAGQNAIERSSNVEAIAHLTRSVDLIKTLPPTMELYRRELKLQTMLGGPMISTKGYGALETGAVFARARELSEKVEDSTLLFPVLYQQWVYDLIGSRIQDSQQRAVNFLRLADEQDESGPKIIGHRINAVSLFYRGELAAARDAFEAALAMYDAAEHRDLAYRFGQDPRAACLAFLTVIDHVTGYPERAAQRSASAVEHAENTKHANTLAYTLSYGPVRSAMIGRDLVAAGGLFDRLLALAEEQGLAMWKGYAQVYKGWILAQKGWGAEAVEIAEHGMVGLSSTRTALDHPLAACCLAEAYGADGRNEDAIRALDDAIASAERTDERWFEAEIHRLRGRWILTHGGDETEGEAERHFQKSIEIAQLQGARLWELRGAMDLANLWRAQGEQPRAFDLLAPLLSWYTEGLRTPDLMDAEALLRDLA